MVFSTEGSFEVAIESLAEWDFSLRPLNSVQALQPTELSDYIYIYIYIYIYKELGDPFSSWTDLLFDVPQWSILEQLLFNIFLCDLFLLMRDLDIASYVDDNMPYDICDDIDEIISDLKHAATSLSI